MKDFDEVRRARATEDRSFQLGGETFVRKAGVRPEVLVPYEELKDTTGGVDALQLIDQIVVDMIETDDDAADRYQAIRERDADPITLGDLTALVEWLVEGMTGRPTSQPSGSMRGPGGTGTTLTEDSSSQGGKRGPTT